MALPKHTVPLISALFAIILCTAAFTANGAVEAQYIRVENPTGFVMNFRQIEVFSEGRNIALHRKDITSGTVPPLPGDDKPTYDSIVVNAPREGADLTNGDTNTSHFSPEWRAYVDPSTGAPGFNPWFELNLGKTMPIEKVVLYGAAYPRTVYLDKGHRLVSLLDKDRKVLWAEKWQYYDQGKFPKGIFSFNPVPSQPGANSVVGMTVAPKARDWVSMGWMLDAEASQPPADAARRAAVFAARNSPEELKKLADQFFPMLDERIPEIAAAKQLYASGKHVEAFDAWKKYWFAKMARVNLHAAMHADYISYNGHGDDLLHGLLVAITPQSARAIKYEPGQINWISIPADGKDLNAALDNCKAKASADKVSWPLLYSFRRNANPAYIQRWSEIMDDWSINYFADAAQTPYEVEDLFTFNPCFHWGTMMEDLSDIAVEKPALVDLIPGPTLARVQLTCLEKYSTGWWRQIRETVFNHNTGGIHHWDAVLPYFDEFHPGQRMAKEWREGFERFMTLGFFPDGSLTEICDEGHQEIPVQLGMNLNRAEINKPAWYTPGWRNRALDWYDNLYKYMFRHLAPGGYEHRYRVDYRPYRWESTTRPYYEHHPHTPPMLDRDKEIFGDPEIRRMLYSFAVIPPFTDPIFKPIVEQKTKAKEFLHKSIGDEKQELPHLTSDWMPYTGCYYFRGGWDETSPFMAMMACGANGGSEPDTYPFANFNYYDYGYPLLSAKCITINGFSPDELQGRRHTFQPGTKTKALANSDEKPLNRRWSSTPNFDFGEAMFHGNFQNPPVLKGSYEYKQEIALDSAAVSAVDSRRQIIQLKNSRLFIITDSLRTPDKTPRDISVTYTAALSTRQKPSRPFGPDQLKIDAKEARLSTDNPDGPNVTLYQFSDQGITLNRRPDAKPDADKYAKRLTGSISIAEQPVASEVKSDHLALVSLIASRDKGATDRVASVEAANHDTDAVGFHAIMQDGTEIWYQSAGFGATSLACGPGKAAGEALLVVKDKTGINGMLLGGKSLSLEGKTIELRDPNCEFIAGANGATLTGIYPPIDPVSFKPGRNTFCDSETVEMISATPHVEIRFTTNGSRPTQTSTLYTGPVKITESTEFSARAYRLGADGKPLPNVDFECSGTKFTEPTYGWFYKRPLQAPAAVTENELTPGLIYERVQAPWWRLYASLHWLPTASTGIAAREMDALPEAGPETYGMRYKGYLRVPNDGVYTFHAPHELVFMAYATSYDLRVYIDGEEWSLTQWWHGHGTWSIPLKKGFHAFQVDFADARTTPWKKSGIWHYYPRPWAIYPGKPTDILLSGPGIETPSRIPQDWLFREAKQASATSK